MNIRIIKILSILLMLYSLSFVGYCNDKVNSHSFSSDNIENEILKDKNITGNESYLKNKGNSINDEVVAELSKVTSNFKLHANKFNIYEDKISDELISDDNFKNTDALKNSYGIVSKIDDEFMQKAIKFTKITAIKTKKVYDYTKKHIPIYLKVDNNYKLSNNTKEGQELKFLTAKDVVIGKLKLPKNTKVNAKIESISASDKMGTPESVTVDNFYVVSMPEIEFRGGITKTGANRSIWVYPLYQAGNFAFYVAGFVFVPIHGGHAKFSKNETFTVYYETTEANM